MGERRKKILKSNTLHAIEKLFVIIIKRLTPSFSKTKENSVQKIYNKHVVYIEQMHYMYISNAIKRNVLRTNIMRQKIRTNKFLKICEEEEKSEKNIQTSSKEKQIRKINEVMNFNESIINKILFLNSMRKNNNGNCQV